MGLAATPEGELPALDLGGRGISSIERVGTGDCASLIIAEPFGAELVASKIIWWDGGTKLEAGSNVTMGSATTEAALIIGVQHAILGDNGNVCRDKADTGERWFPMLMVDLTGK